MHFVNLCYFELFCCSVCNLSISVNICHILSLCFSDMFSQGHDMEKRTILLGDLPHLDDMGRKLTKAARQKWKHQSGNRFKAAITCENIKDRYRTMLLASACYLIIFDPHFLMYLQRS